MSFNKKKKNRTLFIQVIFIVLLVSLGVYLLEKSKSQNLVSLTGIQPTNSPAKSRNQYINTTLGLMLNLPDGWIVCDNVENGVGVTPPPVTSDVCSFGSAPYVVTTAKYYLQFGATTQTIVRQEGESFVDYVKRLDKNYSTIPGVPVVGQPEFKTIDSHTILETISDASKGLRSKIMFIEDSKVGAFIITLGANGFDESNLQIIASGLTNYPVTTGDITGQMSAQVEKNNHFSNLDTPVNFPVILYAEDKNTIVAATKTNKAGVYNFRVKPGAYFINDPGTGWQPIPVSLGEIQTFNGGTITHN